MTTGPEDRFERSVPRKVFWRIVPLCFGLYVVSYLNRANIGYAALQMNQELGLTSAAFGFAAGIFFIGYFLFEVPSNMALARFGARVWIARILITWGLLAALSAFVQNAWQLYVLRFLLGVAEAGFFPGIIIYLTYWVRAKEQATTIAAFTAAIPISLLLGAPISTLIMDHISAFGLSGWRWMLLLEALPPILGGLLTLAFLTDRPEQARWLQPAERAWLTAQIERDRTEGAHRKHLGLFQAITEPKVLLLSAIYFVYQCGSLGVGYWLPQIVKAGAASLSNLQVGLVTTFPYAVATAGMIAWSRRSDRTGERQMHAALPLLVSGLALGAVVLSRDLVTSILLISAALTGLYAFKAPFWALPGLFLSRSTAAVSIAAINSIGNLGGFVGPYAIGLVKDRTGGPVGGLVFLASLTLAAFVLTLRARLRAPAAAA
ncbi:MAG: MFS transporter [Caulobacterales bacterium]|nr:MFS transporter [Caulobacterales bacterium]